MAVQALKRTFGSVTTGTPDPPHPRLRRTPAGSILDEATGQHSGAFQMRQCDRPSMLSRYNSLCDDQWERMRDLLPGREGDVGVTARDNRLFVEAVLYRYRAGIPWRDLPDRFGDWKNVHQRFSRWAKSDIWERVFQHLAADADNEYAMIDSTIVRGPDHTFSSRNCLSAFHWPHASSPRLGPDLSSLPRREPILLVCPPACPPQEITAASAVGTSS